MKNGNKIKKLCIDKSTDLITALKKMDEGAKKTLFVVEDDSKLEGVLTDGDIRRWILCNRELKGYVREFCNTEPIFVYSDYRPDHIRELMLTEKIEAIPVLDADKKMVDILLWEDVFSEESPKLTKKRIEIPVVIMAGGKGTRLDPFTRILPKPLIPVGDKPIIEIIIDKFHEYGITDFYISVNHKSKMIKAYFEELSNTYTVKYVDEDRPLGTAGSLKLLEGRLEGSFFVSNCDILIESDYGEIVNYHHEKKNDMTIVASVKNYRIPYGVCEIENGGTLCRIREKPEYDFLVNTGFYVLKSEVLKLIPEDRFFDITHLMETIRNNSGKIGVFPVSDKSWIDVGEWEEYRKAVRRFEI